MTSTGEAVIFWILGPLMVIAALGLLFVHKAVHAALCVAFVMVNLGVLYIVQQADFLGIVQVFVYTGAVMMFFLFVLMLIGVDSADSLIETIRGQKGASLVVVLGLALVLFFALGSLTLPEPRFLDSVNNDPGNVSGVADLIFGKYVWVFELTSALLITAAVGAMVLAHRERIGAKRNQKSWAERRVRENEFVAGLPAPGVYARHNAADTPALLPDGSPVDVSVSRVLRARRQVEAPGTYHAAEQAIESEIDEGRAR
jgi:NADH-quinone oxidoreductase subunit J